MEKLQKKLLTVNSVQYKTYYSVKNPFKRKMYDFFTNLFKY